MGSTGGNAGLVANTTNATWGSIETTKELVIIPRRGLFYISPQYTSGALAGPFGVAGIFHFAGTTTATPAYPIRFMTSPTPSASPYGYSHYAQTTNGPRTFLAGSSIGYTKNWYTINAINGYSTGRLTLKG